PGSLQPFPLSPPHTDGTTAAKGVFPPHAIAMVATAELKHGDVAVAGSVPASAGGKFSTVQRREKIVGHLLSKSDRLPARRQHRASPQINAALRWGKSGRRDRVISRKADHHPSPPRAARISIACRARAIVRNA